jgi:hypothetical protein
MVLDTEHQNEDWYQKAPDCILVLSGILPLWNMGDA